ncbi:MAG: LytR C-terminal domain-containing protein [Ignavibacteria bacterium]|nr:LytR C-terminal domain-containing protein [Ignavibacteria bacterium]MDH7528078.1 LytR C-terminal domain-containing protein [Ignavibacteria bacterium]
MAESLKTKNTLLNITLFFLGLILLFIAYNIYLSLQKPSDEDLEEKNISGKIIQVKVLNGTQTDGLAKKLTDFLRSKNFDVVIQGNYNERNVKKTFIIDHRGDKKILRKIIKVLKIDPDQVKTDIKEFELSDVTIVIGEDYQKLNSEIKW